jgi:hypothetical protein
MIAYFADGPINGQTRDIPAFMPVYRVPIVEKIGPGYWESAADLREPDDFPSVRVAVYYISQESLDSGAPIYIFRKVER